VAPLFVALARIAPNTALTSKNVAGFCQLAKGRVLRARIEKRCSQKRRMQLLVFLNSSKSLMMNRAASF
jgi:hypothetical protein